MKTSSDQLRRRRIAFALGIADPATTQCLQWIEDTKRIALGMYHYTAPKVHPGQWVRFIGDPCEVAGRDRGTPTLGSYGQVWLRDGKRGNDVIVLFLGSRKLFRLNAFELEPLVGTPLGRPRSYLRFYKRWHKGFGRRGKVSEGAQ